MLAQPVGARSHSCHTCVMPRVWWTRLVPRTATHARALRVRVRAGAPWVPLALGPTQCLRTAPLCTGARSA
eukprot:8475140-Alexandrium_andersonii.AAC.1